MLGLFGQVYANMACKPAQHKQIFGRPQPRLSCALGASRDSRDIKCELLSFPEQLQACSLPHKLLADQVAERDALTSPAGAQAGEWGAVGGGQSGYVMLQEGSCM